MWKRLPDDEIERRTVAMIKKRHSYTTPLIVGTVVAMSTFLLFSAGFRGTLRAFSFTTPSLKLSHLIAAVIGGSVVGLLFYRHRVKTPIGGDNYLRCRQCCEIGAVNAERRCQCGGELEPSEFFTWEEDGEPA